MKTTPWSPQRCARPRRASRRSKLCDADDQQRPRGRVPRVAPARPARRCAGEPDMSSQATDRRALRARDSSSWASRQEQRSPPFTDQVRALRGRLRLVEPRAAQRARKSPRLAGRAARREHPDRDRDAGSGFGPLRAEHGALPRVSAGASRSCRTSPSRLDSLVGRERRRRARERDERQAPCPDAFYQRLAAEQLATATSGKKSCSTGARIRLLIAGVVTRIGDNTIDGSIRGPPRRISSAQLVG